MQLDLGTSTKRGPAHWVTQWLVSAVGLALVARWVQGVHLEATGSQAILTILGAAAVLGLLNVLVKPILLLVTLPVTILTLGLFTLVINGVVLKLVAMLVPQLRFESFGTAIWAAFLLSVISLVLNALTGGSSVSFQFEKRRR